MKACTGWGRAVSAAAVLAWVSAAATARAAESAATPEDAVKIAAKAFKTGTADADDALAILTKDHREAMTEGRIALNAAKALSDLLNEKFKKTLPEPDTYDFNKSFLNATTLTAVGAAKIDGDKAVITVKVATTDAPAVQETMMHLRKEDGGWKIMWPGTELLIPADIVKMMRAMKAAAEKVAAAVKAGELKTWKEASDAFDKAAAGN